MSGLKLKTNNSKILQVIIITSEIIICLKRSCFGQDIGQYKEIQRDSPKYESREVPFSKTNIITSDILPWQIVAPNETGFDLTENEIAKFKIWSFGIIPYFIDDYSFDILMISRLKLILNAVNSVTGLRFVELLRPPESEDERYVLFINRRSTLLCEDYNFKSFTTKGVQRVVLGYDCVQEGGGALAPTILALVGVPPQHNSPDRDKYITVQIDNIMPDKKQFFQKLEDNEWLFHDMKYDFHSAGHYNFHKYTLNGSATIKPKFNVNASVGEDNGFSYNDIWKIKMLYNFVMLKTGREKTSPCSQLFKIKNNTDLDKIKVMKAKNARKKPPKYLAQKSGEINKGFGNQANKKDETKNVKIAPKNKIAKLKFPLGEQSRNKFMSLFEQKNPWVHMSDYETDEQQ